MHIYNTCIYNCRNEIIQGWLSSQTQPFWKLIFLKVHNANVAVMATRLKSFLITFYLVSISLRYCKRITFSYVFYFGFGRKAASAKSRTLLNALHTCKRISTLFKFLKFKSTLVNKISANNVHAKYNTLTENLWKFDSGLFKEYRRISKNQSHVWHTT